MPASGRPGSAVTAARSPVSRAGLRASGCSATDAEEIEANQFAAAILMPADLVIGEARRLLKDPSATDASIVPLLAQGFDVSDQAMEYRLVNLGLRRQL